MIAVEWLEREPPLSPCATLARGEKARELVERLLSLDSLQGLAGVGAPGLVVVTGHVPWVDGLTWLGIDPLAPALRLPTTRRPSVPLPLFQRAVLATVKSAHVAVVPGLMVPLGDARPLSRDALKSWRHAA